MNERGLKSLCYGHSMYVKVRATAGAKREEILRESETHFNITVREKAERNEANTRIRELIALHFRVPLGKVRIVNGHQSPSKLLDVATEDE